MAIWLYRLRATRVEMVTMGPTPSEEALLGDHALYLAGLAEAGRVQLYGRTIDESERTFGLVVFEASSEQEASRIMEEDPAVREGAMHAELFPFRTVYLRASGGGSS